MAKPLSELTADELLSKLTDDEFLQLWKDHLSPKKSNTNASLNNSLYDWQDYLKNRNQSSTTIDALRDAFAKNPNNLNSYGVITDEALDRLLDEANRLESGQSPTFANNFKEAGKINIFGKELTPEELIELEKFQSKINNPEHTLSPDDFRIEKIPHKSKEGAGAYNILNPVTGAKMGEFPYVKYSIPLDELASYRFGEEDYLNDDKLRAKLNRILKNSEKIDLKGSADDLIKMSFPNIDTNLKGRGLGNQIYSLIERDLNKKIMPDEILTDNSKNLHQNYGLGKKFGSDNYKDSIIESQKKALKQASEKIQNDSIEKLTDSEIDKVAEHAYRRFKDSVNYSLPDFKSFAPTFIKGLGAGAVAKGAAALATGGASLAAQAVEEGIDSNSANDDENDVLRLMKMEEDLKRARQNNSNMKDIFEKADNELRKFGAADLIDPDAGSDKPKFKQLLNKLNKK